MVATKDSRGTASGPKSRAAIPLIGRERELAALSERLDLAGQGQGGLMLIAGEPGIGKTRLLQQFAALGRAAGWLVLSGRAYDTEGMPPYLPFVEAIRQRLTAIPDEGLAGSLGIESAAVARLIPELGERLSPAKDDGSHADRRVEEELDRYRLFESITEVFLRWSSASECRGLLLLLDDLHWADRPTVLLLLHLARKLSDRSLLVVGSYRTEEIDPAAPFFSILADLTREYLAARLTVGPLSLADTGLLIENLALPGPQPSAETLAEIHRQARGNPFYIEELARHTRALSSADGAVNARWSVPESVREVIGRRLSALDMPLARLLQCGAILGDGFAFEVAAFMTALDESVLMDALDQAISSGFIRERGDVCHFSHPLIQRTIYDGLSAARRRALHLRAAETIERIYARHLDPHLASLAANYRLAGTRADPDKTTDYLVRAGEAAEKALAYEQAASNWNAALELMERHGFAAGDRASLLERLGDLMHIIGLESYTTGLALFEQALALYQECGALLDAARVHARMGLLLAAGGAANDNVAALQHLRAAEEVLEDAPSGEAQLWLYSALGLVCVWQIRPDEGLRASRRAVDLATELGRHDRWVTNTVMCAYHLHNLGRLAEGFDLLEAAWQRADAINETYSAFVSSTWLGNRLLSLLDPLAAASACSREADQRRQIEAPSRHAGILNFLSAALAVAGRIQESRQLRESNKLTGTPELALLDGRWDAIETYWTRMRESALKREHTGDCIGASIGLARLRFLKGDFSGVDLLHEAFAVALQGPSAVMQIDAGPELVIQLAALNRLEEARPVLDRCRRLLSSGEDWRGRTGRVWLAEAAFAWAGSGIAEAQAPFDRALAVFERYSLPWDTAGAYYLRAHFLRGRGNRERSVAVESLDTALEIYHSLSAAQPWIDRVLELRKRIPGHRESLAPSYPDGLTPREAEILRLIARGSSNREIAEALVLSIRTVERHITNIYAKIGARGKADATAYALHHSLS